MATKLGQIRRVKEADGPVQQAVRSLLSGEVKIPHLRPHGRGFIDEPRCCSTPRAVLSAPTRSVPRGAGRPCPGQPG